MIGEFVMKALHARTNAHVLHLKSRSYARHIALGEFYDALVDLLDSYVEAYQGAFGIIEEYPGRYVYVDDPVKLVEGLCEHIDNNAEALSAGEPSLRNIPDELCAVRQQQSYKLRLLK